MSVLKRRRFKAVGFRALGNLRLFKMIGKVPIERHARVRSAKAVRIFYIIAVITTVFYLSKIRALKTVRSGLITTIM